ncbi:MAG: winged helix-turn-helix transcriptional regulator [Nostoc sp. ChiSLP01]
MVEYSLTPLGKTLNQVLKNFCDWSRFNFKNVEAARNRYDNGENRSLLKNAIAFLNL